MRLLAGKFALAILCLTGAAPAFCEDFLKREVFGAIRHWLRAHRDDEGSLGSGLNAWGRLRPAACRSASAVEARRGQRVSGRGAISVLPSRPSRRAAPTAMRAAWPHAHLSRGRAQTYLLLGAGFAACKREERIRRSARQVCERLRGRISAEASRSSWYTFVATRASYLRGTLAGWNRHSAISDLLGVGYTGNRATAAYGRLGYAVDTQTQEADALAVCDSHHQNSLEGDNFEDWAALAVVFHCVSSASADSELSAVAREMGTSLAFENGRASSETLPELARMPARLATTCR